MKNQITKPTHTTKKKSLCLLLGM